MVSSINTYDAIKSTIPSSIDNTAELRNCKDKNEQLKKTAQQFESVFVNQLLTVMDQTVDRDENGLFKEGKYAQNFRSMLNQYVSQEISSNPASSIGLAKQMYEQMKDKV